MEPCARFAWGREQGPSRGSGAWWPQPHLLGRLQPGRPSRATPAHPHLLLRARTCITLTALPFSLIPGLPGVQDSG